MMVKETMLTAVPPTERNIVCEIHNKIQVFYKELTQNWVQSKVA